MEISILFGVTILLAIMMVAMSYINHTTTKILKQEIADLREVTNEANDWLGNTLLTNIKDTKDELQHSTDNLANALNDITKEHEVNLNYAKEQASINAANIQTLIKEIKRVEKGYKEKINY